MNTRTPNSKFQIPNSPNLADLTAIILAGGQGTRLRSVLADVPKVLAPLEGRPFLAWLLDQLAAAGLRRVVISTGYRAEEVRRTLGPRHGPLELVYSPETTPLGTGGALRAALDLAPGPTILALNGDSYCRADWAAFRRFHADHQAAGTLLLAEVPDTARFGRVDCDDAGLVTRFDEKQAAAGPGWINAGIYLLRRDLIAAIPPAGPVSLERETFPACIGRGLHAFPGARQFLDIGTPESYAAARAFFGRRVAVLDRDGTIIAERHYLSDPAQVELLPGAAEGLRRLRAMGWGLVVVTNQSGVARGYFDLARVAEIHRRLEDLLAAEGVRLDGIYICPHLPDADCPCRKPRTGLIGQAAAELGFDPARAIVIGDKPCDIELGQAARVPTILVRTGYGAQHETAATVRPDAIVDDLRSAAEQVRDSGFGIRNSQDT